MADLQGVHELAVTSLMNGHLQYMTSQPGEAQRAGLAQPGGKKTKDDLVHAYKCPMVEDNRTRLSSGVKWQYKWQWVQTETLENPCKLMMIFAFFCYEGGHTLGHQRGHGASILSNIQHPTGHDMTLSSQAPWHCSEQGFGSDNVQMCIPTSVILWIFEKILMNKKKKKKRNN